MIASEMLYAESLAFVVYVPLDTSVRALYTVSYYRRNAGTRRRNRSPASCRHPLLCKVVLSTPLNADYRIVTPIPNHSTPSLDM